MKSKKTPKRIGIYSGSFDPVHRGHIAFALHAIAKGKLDEVYFVPETTRPWRKEYITHIAHRLAMLEKATALYPNLKVLHLPDKKFTVPITLPKLMHMFPGHSLHFLMGSDIFQFLEDWPMAEQLCRHVGIMVSVREGEMEMTRQTVELFPYDFKELHVLRSSAPTVSSRRIREALARGRWQDGLLSTAYRYHQKHWLYVSLEGAK